MPAGPTTTEKLEPNPRPNEQNTIPILDLATGGQDHSMRAREDSAWSGEHRQDPRLHAKQRSGPAKDSPPTKAREAETGRKTLQTLVSSLDSVILAAYYSTLGVLALYGSHRLLLLFHWWRTREDCLAPPPDPENWPHVTVQVPLYNEQFVVERVLDAVAALQYPSDLLEIQVLDDSTDETLQITQKKVTDLRAQGVDIKCLHRADRVGFKAGALAAGLEQARGELICIFDSDFVPRSDFLQHLVPHFQDPRIGMVQARWDHLNRDDSLLTKIQAVLLDGHFAIEHVARHRSGLFFNFNGTGGIWRREAILDAGGWTADTLTEDLDLSYRAQLAGWRFLYLPQVTVPAELPTSITAFKSQQHRWSRGSIQTGRKLIPRILRADLPRTVKVEALVHLTNNLSYPLMVLLALLVFPAMVLRRGSEIWKLLAFDAPLFLAATVSVLLFYIASQWAVGRPWKRTWKVLPGVLATGMGLAINNSAAVLGGLLRQGGVFHRTPKTGSHGKGRNSAYRLPISLSWWFEGLMALYFLTCSLVATSTGMWLSLPFLYLFLQGFTYLFILPLLTRPTRLARDQN